MLLGIGMINTSRCQQYFNIRDAMHSQSTILTSVLEHNGKYYVTGLCIDSINYIGNNTFSNVEGIKFAVFDSTGAKLRDTFYQRHFPQQYEPWNVGDLYLLSDNTFVMASQYLDSEVNYNYIVKFDSLGHMLWEKQFSKPLCTDHEWYKVKDLKPLNTGEWLMLSDMECSVNQYPFYHAMLLEKLDSNFNILWSKQYCPPPSNHIPNRILVEADGYLLAGGNNNSNLVNAGYVYKPELVKVDTAGNWVWTWIRPGAQLSGYANDVIRTHDGGYLYCGAGDGYEDFEPNFKGWVEKLDSNRNVVWSKSFNRYYWTTQFKKVIEQQNGDIVLFGDKYCPVFLDSDDANLHTRGWYLKLNANGDSLAEHTYYYLRTCSDENLVDDVKQTSDGGFIMVGESTDYCGGQAPTQRGWLVKIDSNGCIDPVTCDQQDTSTEVRQITAIKDAVRVYPNPVRDNLQIGYENIPDGEIAVLDVTGRVLLKQKLEHNISLKQLASGVYFYRITDKGMIIGQGKLIKE